MSRKYQGMIVLNTKSLEGTIDDLVSTVSKEIESAGAKVENIDNIGRRDFAYTSNKIQAGHFVSYTFSGDSSTVAKVQEKLALNGHVHNQLIQRL